MRLGREAVEQAQQLGAAHASREGWHHVIVGQDVADDLERAVSHLLQQPPNACSGAHGSSPGRRLSGERAKTSAASGVIARRPLCSRIGCEIVAVDARINAADLARQGVYRDGDAPAVLARVFGAGVRPLRIDEAVFDAMLEGWRRQQLSRGGKLRTVEANAAVVRRVRDHVDAWPWEWQAEHVEAFIAELAVGPPPRRPATLRNYQSRLRMFLGFAADERYPWPVVCRHEFGRAPLQLFDGRNLIVHVDDWEADPGRRALSRGELQAFFDFCDEQVAGRRALRRKGALAALRDAALFKVAYGWGCCAPSWSASTSSTCHRTRACRCSAASG